MADKSPKINHTLEPFYFRKVLENKKGVMPISITPLFSAVGMTGFEPATTRPPDAYSNRAELHPVFYFTGAKVAFFC